METRKVSLQQQRLVTVTALSKQLGAATKERDGTETPPEVLPKAALRQEPIRDRATDKIKLLPLLYVFHTEHIEYIEYIKQ